MRELLENIGPIKKGGFTLVELVLTIMIVGIIASVTAKILITGLDVYSLIINRTNTLQSAREAMERMVDEITLLRWNDVTRMDNARLGFIDRKSVTTSFRQYSVDSNPCLYRGNDYMAAGLGSLDFDYLKEDDSAAFFNWQMRKIKVEFTLDDLAGFGSVHLRTTVFPRSFMYSDFE